MSQQTVSHKIPVISALLALPLMLFSYLAFAISGQTAPGFDTSILHWIHSHSSYICDKLFLVITTAGNTEVIAPLTLLLVAYLWYRRWHAQALFIFASFFGAGALDFAFKQVFHRARPSLWHSAITETSYSFPSGHAILSSALAFSLIAILWSTRWRWTAVASGAISIVLIGYSRLYLGVHYPSDVVAAWCVSAVWVNICWLAFRAGIIQKLKRHLLSSKL